MPSQRDIYSKSFYAGHGEVGARSADLILPLVLSITNPQSILDAGCGEGNWLASALRLGVPDLMGVDGDWVRQDMLKVRPNYFTAVDLCRPFDLKRRFDLVMSLEVAEHLPESAAIDFVQSLSRHGDIILFSAAIPGQGGRNHLNEQWPPYWIDLFANLGYAKFDFIRGRIWDEPLVSPWYLQNILLFARDSGVARCPSILAAAKTARQCHSMLFTP